jgi:hypothetical protein
MSPWREHTRGHDVPPQDAVPDAGRVGERRIPYAYGSCALTHAHHESTRPCLCLTALLMASSTARASGTAIDPRVGKSRAPRHAGDHSAYVGHFAAWEQPELFAAELRAAFQSLR